MGILIKVILFGLVIYYIFRTVGNFVFKILGGQRQPQAHQRQQHNAKKEGEINIDHMPNKGRNGKRGAGAKEGDYIDYEELK